MQILNTRIDSLRKVPVFFSDELELSPQRVQDFIQKHMQYRQRYDLLYDYYTGNHGILTRVMDISKPNNKMIDNFSQYITDVKSGYFMGKPVSYAMKAASKFTAIQTILDRNDEADNNSELAKLASIFGHSFELLYLNEDGDTSFHYVDPRNLLMVYDMTIEQKPIAAIRYFSYPIEGQTLARKVKAELYLAKSIVYFEGDTEQGLRSVNEKPHPFGAVPVVEYKNNDERLGDFENVISLIDAYELVMADSTNEIQYFSDAYLVIRNMMMTDGTDIANMKDNRVISLDENGEAKWLVKDVNDEHIMHLLDRLKKDIHKFSKTPNLSDEEFVSNLSGVAIRFKLWGLEQDAVNKERKFRAALLQRFRLISNVLKMTEGTDFWFADLKITFSRNIPHNILEQVQMITSLNGIVSMETLLSQLPFVDDVAEEVSKLEKEAKRQQELFGLQNPPQEDGEDSDTPFTAPTDKQAQQQNNALAAKD